MFTYISSNIFRLIYEYSMTLDFVWRKQISMIKSLSRKLFELIYECKSILRKVFQVKQSEERLSIQTYIFENIVGSTKNNT